MDQPDVRATATVRDALPLRLHHNAFVVKDHEVNRRFFEDLLGMPLVATWCEKNFIGEVKREVEFCHTFFALADGGALAFFQFADPEVAALAAPVFSSVGRFQHIALKIDAKGYDEIARRLTAAAIAHRQTDHGYCRSMYVTSPDGLIVEFTVDPADADRIAGLRRADAHAELARWLKGDRRVNNDIRPH
ncbi:MAG: VOC family protein [Proteobacteria bacterium]|nr:VOC family protein [Pseudomonadota bacterium]